MRSWLLALLLLQGDADADAAAAYRAGDFQQAFAAFAAAERQAGDAAPAELVHNVALAALRAGRLAEADAAAQRLAQRDPARFHGLAQFLLGSSAFARSERAEAAAKLQDAEPGAWDSAIRAAEAARDAWVVAAAGRDDWPAARRNVERMLARLVELRRQKEAAERARRNKSLPKPQPLPVPGEQQAPATEPGGEQAEHDPQVAPLAPEQVQRLFDRLLAKEREKQALRQAQQQWRAGDVERDW